MECKQDTHTAKSPRKRPYNFMLVQRPEYLKPPYNTLDKLLNRLEKIGAESYAGIVHDKDSGETPHIHIFMHFPHGREISAVAKKLNIDPQWLECWDDGIDNGFAYLTHRTKKAHTDYQYNPCEVQANFDYAKWLHGYEARQKEKKQIRKEYNGDIKHLLDCLYIGAITKEEVEQKLSGSQYATYHKKIDDVWAKRLQNVAEQRIAERKASGEKVTVVWIYGVSGAGKTRFAKEQAAKADRNYFITGSSRDPFQRYGGQDVIIYDEARPGDIAFSDLLKLLDPFGEDVSAPSRYYDKAICASIYYITSPYSPLEFYRRVMGDGWRTTPDGYDQLLRRLSLIIQMSKTIIQAVRYSFSEKEFVPIPETVRPNMYWKNTEILEKEAVTIFNSFFKDTAVVDNIARNDHG